MDSLETHAHQQRLRRAYKEQQRQRRLGLDNPPSIERDMNRINGAIYTLLLPVFFAAIIALCGVLGFVPLLVLLRWHG